MDKKKKIIFNNESKRRRLFKSEKRKEQKILYIIYGVIAVFMILFVLGIITSLKINTKSYIIEYANLPQSFDGYRIVQLSDYHKGVYGNDNDALVDGVKALEPDIIVLTGDFIDKSSKDIDNISNLCENLTEISQVLWVRGNHFYKTNEGIDADLVEKMESLGVVSLVNESYIISRDGENITFCGVDDPEDLYAANELPGEYTDAANRKVMERNLEEVEQKLKGDSGFKILLSHRYSIYDLFPEYGYSLTLAGHSHGGQLKLPGGVDLIGYNLDLFPKVHSGYNDIDGMPLIVNSGLGVSNLNLRLYNPPEIIFIELKNK